MKSQQLCLSLILVFLKSTVVLCTADTNTTDQQPQPIGQNDTVSNETMATYDLGVRKGIINPNKYTLKSFENDERNIFKDSYKEYISMNDSQPINYQEWLVMNNFGVLIDSQVSLFEKFSKHILRIQAHLKEQFVNLVKAGDILISGHGIRALLGHSAIMASDDLVLEMPGGIGWQDGLADNNNVVEKHQWFDQHAKDSVTVYRCPDRKAAKEAAEWVRRNYYSIDGNTKTEHITYKITKNFRSINPSYCSKLVIQAYHYGPTNKNIIKNLTLIGRAIIPSTIPTYFQHPYKLINMGTF